MTQKDLYSGLAKKILIAVVAERHGVKLATIEKAQDRPGYFAESDMQPYLLNLAMELDAWWARRLDELRGKEIKSPRKSTIQ